MFIPLTPTGKITIECKSKVTFDPDTGDIEIWNGVKTDHPVLKELKARPTGDKAILLMALGAALSKVLDSYPKELRGVALANFLFHVEVCSNREAEELIKMFNGEAK